MLDIWRAAAPSLDLFAPDIYAPDFRQITAEYHRAGNPLFIPESLRAVNRAWYAFGEHHALGFSPFAIDSWNADDGAVLAESYRLIGGLSPLLDGSHDSRGILFYPDDQSQQIDLGDYRFDVVRARSPFGPPPAPSPEAPAGRPAMDTNPGGILIDLGGGKFLAAGAGFTVNVETNPAVGKRVNFVKIEEGIYEKGVWTARRHLNGDENHITLRQTGELIFTVYPF
jgi:hypothetical protein